MINFLIFLVIYFILNKICLKFNFLIDKKETSEHKKKILTDMEIKQIKKEHGNGWWVFVGKYIYK